MASDIFRVYRSGYDLWLMVLIYASPALLLVIAAYSWVDQQPDATLVCLIMSAALTLLNLAITVPCRYTLTSDSLNVRCGLYSRTIPLSRVVSVEPSSTWESAPALSLRRVKIVLDRGHQIISPADRDSFIRDLTEAIESMNA
jgi:hypothetical protein